MTTICPVVPLEREDWPAVKELRLRALADSPQSFGSSLDRESAFQPDDWRALIDPKVAEHGGRVVRIAGDGLLVEFASVVAAVRCAVEFQRAMRERNAGIAADKRIEFRVGINFGDIIVHGDDVWGDGVNVAARLEAMAYPGGICVSRRVQLDVDGKLDVAFEDTGTQQLKNIAYATQGNAQLASRYAIVGSLVLYVDFINIFMSILRILGNRR